MDIFRTTSPSARQAHESHRESPERQSYPRAFPYRSAGGTQGFGAPMAIPTAPITDAPPPLPPPRYIEDFEHGLDPGWTWANSREGRESGKVTLAPIRHGSSLQGGYLHGPEGSRRPEVKAETDIDLDRDGRRASSVSTLRSFSELSKSQGQPDSHQDPTQSTASIPSYQLQGEHPLAQRSLEHSSNQYDKHLLSKIDRAYSPQRSRVIPRSDSLPASGYYMPPDVQSRSLSSVEIPSPLGGASPLRINKALPRISPTAPSGWRDYSGFSGLGNEGSGSPVTSDAEKWHFTRQQEHGRGLGLTPFLDETNSLSSRSNRGSYDQSLMTESDMEQQSEETTAFRHLKIEDRDRGIPERRLSRQANKRRKRSTSREKQEEPQLSTQLTTNFDSNQRAFFRSAFPRSPDPQYRAPHGSISSVSSGGPRHGSYASSAGFSVGGSSITSVSSFDKPSPGGVSPRSDVIDSSQDSPRVSSTLYSQSSASLPSRPVKAVNAQDTKHSTSLPGRNLTHNNNRTKIPPKAGGAFVCACCPKKPKRFPNAEELRLHTTEKQYECAYCGNRFKNKNEAERHQNSLHLRLHSWSCVAIAGPEAAFHPTNAGSAQSHIFAPTDSCGYCGEEFSNIPRPDLDARKEHLVVVHKFGECNKSKKFFRADHFRQHLKHSHAGTSGKWTNMLENACIKDEPPIDDTFTNASDSPSNDPGLTPASVGCVSIYEGTIDEEDDES